MAATIAELVQRREELRVSLYELLIKRGVLSPEAQFEARELAAGTELDPLSSEMGGWLARLMQFEHGRPDSELEGWYRQHFPDPEPNTNTEPA